MMEAAGYYPPETRVLPLTTLRSERMLRVPGKVLVNPGEHLQASQPVAQAEISGEVSVVNVGRVLRVPAARAHRYVKVKEGDDVKTSSVIAAKGLLPSSRIKSPVNGFVYRVDKATGRVLIKVVSQPFELKAYLAGTVSHIVAGRGVIIETSGALIQAAIGFGGESFGVLQVAASQPTDVLRSQSIDVTMNGAIVVGGAWIDEAALQQAVKTQVRGLIVGSLEGALLETVRKLPFPILLTEGLGRIPMSEPIFKLLQSHAGREASISAVTHTRWGVVRPEILIPLPADSQPEPPSYGMLLAAGVRVRIVRGSKQGAVGTVTAIPPQPRQIESGARVHGAEINLGGEEDRVFVPFANLEILR